MRIALLGDVGQPVYHVGDEAMAHACVDELGARGHEDVLLLTRNVEETRRLFRKAAAPTLQFPWPPEERAEYLDLVIRAAHGDTDALPPEDQVWDLITAMRACDALLIAGGGNMNSTYGWLLYERAAVAGIACALGLPVAIAGQTIGPVLYGRDRDVAKDLIGRAALVGARESYTLSLARHLAETGQHKVASCLDDATFYAGRAAAKVKSVDVGDSLAPAGPYIAATFSGGHGPADREAYIKAVAAALDQAALATGCAVVLLAHMSTPGLGDGDEGVHSEIAAAMTVPVVAPPILSAEDTAALTAGASMVITSRYHSVVFALDAGLPVVALACEDYSHARLNGALQNWGLGPLALTLPSLFDGTFSSAVEEVWKRRSDVAAHLAAIRTVKAEEFALWWDRVTAALAGADGLAGIDANIEPGSHATDLSFQGTWVKRAALSKAFFLPLSAETAELRVEREHLSGRLGAATRDAEVAREQLQRWLDSRSFALIRKLAPIRTLVGKLIK
ncbi:polysaccharide pyruvyl transferase family protein [Arthrobacter sp. YAF17]|uniref:polysaccharide pyruvyl transferase family protein n=1 Tax=Arthrobacter sp. YAF17 TaxID=3233077 RepID=UPI003F926BF7